MPVKEVRNESKGFMAKAKEKLKQVREHAIVMSAENNGWISLVPQSLRRNTDTNSPEDPFMMNEEGWMSVHRNMTRSPDSNSQKGQFNGTGDGERVRSGTSSRGKSQHSNEDDSLNGDYPPFSSRQQQANNGLVRFSLGSHVVEGDAFDDYGVHGDQQSGGYGSHDSGISPSMHGHQRSVGGNCMPANSRYFGELDEQAVATLPSCGQRPTSRLSAAGSQQSNASIASVGPLGLPYNVQPFRWVPYAGTNGMGWNPFFPPPPPQQQQQKSLSPQVAQHPMHNSNGYGNYWYGNQHPHQQQHQQQMRNGNGYGNYWYGNQQQQSPQQQQQQLSYDPPQSYSSDAHYQQIGSECYGDTSHDNDFAVSDGRRTFNPQPIGGLNSFQQIHLRTFYGPIGELGIEASKKRRAMEEQNGTHGQTERAYVLSKTAHHQGYGDGLMSTTNNGILLMTLLWCDPDLLTGAAFVESPQLSDNDDDDNRERRRGWRRP